MTDYQLLIQKGPEPGKIIPLTSASVTIGRDPMVEITIDDVEVSRQHTRLSQTHAGYQVQDLGSTNGTYLDGVRLGGGTVTLQPGQILALGSGVTLIYQTVPDPEDEAVVLATMLDMSNPLMEEKSRATIVEDDEVIGIEWSEEVEEEAEEIEADVAETPFTEPEMPGFAESGTEILFDSPEPESEEEPLVPYAAPIIAAEAAQEVWPPENDPIQADDPILEPEPVRSELFEWDASADSATLVDFENVGVEVESETAVDPTPEPPPSEPVAGPAKPHVTIDQPDKPKPNNRRTITILLTILILLCCCGCGLLYFMYAIGGDIIIDALSSGGF